MFFILPFLTNAQMYTVSKDSKVEILGTSSVHDWESKVENVTGKGNVKLEGSALKELNNLKVVFEVKSIESGKSKMNSLTYEALKEEDHPNIIFSLKELSSTSDGKVTGTGKLNLAGKIRTVQVNGNIKITGNSVIISGEQPLNMTDYDIEPPTAMFGTIKVGEEVTIRYNLVLKK